MLLVLAARTAGRFPRRSARAVAATPEGFARSMTHGVGTTCWLAPELIKDNTGTETIDVYAFGIALWELATREEVYHNLSAAQIISLASSVGAPSAPGVAYQPTTASSGFTLARRRDIFSW